MINFFDTKTQNKRLLQHFHNALDNIIDSSQIILGKNVKEFEKEFAAWNGSKYAVGVANGTDALVIALKCLDVGPGDEVITVANTAVPTVNAICQTGATPVFSDIRNDTFLMDPSDLLKRITRKTKAIIPVHLYGNPVDMDEIIQIADKQGIHIIEDCCQAHGAKIKNKKVGNFGIMGCFSFYPTKNLGALGDGGLIITNSKTLAQKIAKWRFYGFNKNRESTCLGQNSRLDELQAAFLRIKLKYADEWLAQRQKIARYYHRKLSADFKLQRTIKGGTHAYHLFVVLTKSRKKFQKWLLTKGISIGIHYQRPVFKHPAYNKLNNDIPVTCRISRQNVSLPMYPELSAKKSEKVVQTIKAFFPKEIS